MKVCPTVLKLPASMILVQLSICFDQTSTTANKVSRNYRNKLLQMTYFI